MLRRTCLSILVLLAPALAIAQPRPAEPLPPLSVVVTVAPLKGLVQPLLPLGSEVRVLMTPGKSEHGYEFKPADLALLAKADVVVYVGLGLEPKMPQVLKNAANPSRRVVSFAQTVGLEAAPLQPAADPPEPHDQHADHDHADHDHHDHAGPDPHLWLDPMLCADLVPVVAKAVVEALDAKAPLTDLQRQELARAEAIQLVAVTRIDEQWRAALAPLAGRAIVTHHDAFSRPAERYGLRIAAVIRHAEGAESTPGQIAATVQAIKEEGVRALFIEPQFDPKAARRIADAAGVKVATLDPLGDGDWLRLMKANLDALVANLSDPAPAAPVPPK